MPWANTPEMESVSRLFHSQHSICAGRATSSGQASYPSLSPIGGSSLNMLSLLSPPSSLRWSSAGTLKTLVSPRRLNRHCKIRRYISAYKAAHLDEDISEWPEWANAKADWYDPTISRKDELLGKRDHAKAKDEKTPKHSGYWW